MRSLDYAVVVIVLLFALGLRVIGTATFGRVDAAKLPSTAPYDMLHAQTPLQPDEYALVAIPYDMVLRKRLNPGFYEYPSGLMYLNYVLYQVTGTLRGISLDDRLNASLREFAPFELYFLSRMYAVLAGVLSVACAYTILRLVSGRFAALIGALLVATSFLLVQHAHYIKPGIPATALMMIALWASVAALYAHRRVVTYKMYLLSGVATGAAATVRYNAAAIGIVLFLSGLLLLWRHHTRRMGVVVLVAWLLVPITFFIGTPFALLDFQEFYRQFAHISAQFLSTGSNINPVVLTTPSHGFMILLRFLIVYGFGIPATVAIVVDIYGAWRNRPKNIFKTNSELLLILLLLPFMVAYMLVTMRTVRPIFSDNVLLLILPQGLLLAAIGANWLYSKLPLPKWLLAPAITFVMLIMPLVWTMPAVALFAQVETRVRMQDWIYEHVPVGSRFLLLGGHNVPLDPARYPHIQNFNFMGFDATQQPQQDYLLVSDALWDLMARADALVTDGEFVRWQRQIDSIEAAFPLVAWIDRPTTYPGYREMLNMMAYWHQPGLRLYCLHEAACEALSP